MVVLKVTREPCLVRELWRGIIQQFWGSKIGGWDETYFHHRHNPKNRTVLMVRDPLPGDPHDEPEPWTWVRTEGKGRVFYTPSGHDERVWNHSSFHQLLKQGILWAVGDKARNDTNPLSRIASHSSMKNATISKL